MTHRETFSRLAYSVEDAAAALGISRSSAYRLIASGQLHSVKLGGRRLVPAVELAQLMGSQQAAPSAFPNGGEPEIRGCQTPGPPERAQAPVERPARVGLSALLAQVLEPPAGR